MHGFIARVGGMVVAPVSTLREAAQGGRGGLRDLLLLLAIQIAAVELARLAGAVLYLVRVSYAAGLNLLINAIAGAVWMPLAAVLIAALVLARFVKPARADAAASATSGSAAAAPRTLDLAALSAVPSIALQLAASLAVALAGIRPGRSMALAILAAGGIWFLLLLGFSVRLIRGNRDDHAA